jgi:hypothetical protein
MSNDVTPFYDPGDTITGRADGAITGKRLVVIAGAREDSLVVVSQAGANGRVFAVANRDAADGADVSLRRPGAIVPVTVGASALSAGDPVKSDAAGKLVVASAVGDECAGIVLDDADAGADGMLSFHPFVFGGTATVTGDLAAVADVATADASDAASAATLANANKAKINTILARLRSAGIIAT